MLTDGTASTLLALAAPPLMLTEATASTLLALGALPPVLTWHSPARRDFLIEEGKKPMRRCGAAATSVQLLRRHFSAQPSVDPHTRLLNPQLSHVLGPTDEPLCELSVDGLFLRGLAELAADRIGPALVCPEEGVRLTHSELDDAGHIIAVTLPAL